MASTTTTTTQTKTRQGKGNRGGRKGSGQRNNNPSNPKQIPPPALADNVVTEVTEDVLAAADEADVCWICAEPVKYYSISECNHRTCHVCALRLRALYKKTDCTFCKEPQASVIFTVSPDATFASFTPDAIPYKDPKLSIFFETQEMMEDTLILLRFNCPDSDCDYTAGGWGDLKLHVRGTHGKLMCDLCIRTKKVFAHEHAIYAPNILPLHLPSIPSRGSKSLAAEKIEGGIHPLCEFCRECFSGDDEIYAHMRERHEECFVCKRNEIMHQYFQDYNALERHFMNSHHPCKQPSCLVQKFVVFGTAMDLKAHTVEEHGAEMSSRDKKDARRVEADFEFEQIAAGRRRREGGNNRDRDREPPPPSQTTRQPANVRRRDFGANLTSDGPQTSDPPGANQVRTSSPLPSDVDPLVFERHAALLSRLRSLAPNPQGAVNAFKSAIRSYRSSESGARDLISTVWNVLDHNLDGTASIINATVDILDEEEKKSDLLRAWNGFKVEQRNQFPELVPTAIGGNYAGITGGRVLNAKSSTATKSSQSSRQMLDRVAHAAASSSRLPQRPPEKFPALQPSAATTSAPKAPAFRQPQHTTPWSASASASASGSRATSSVPSRPNSSNSTAKKPTPPPLSKSAFPELPASVTTRAPKGSVNGNQSLRKILGDSTPANPAWGAAVSSGNQESIQNGGDETTASGKGKKGKGKQKQTLFTLGAFPT